MNIKSEYYTEIDETMKKFDLNENLREPVIRTLQQAEDDFLLFTLSLI